MAINHKSDVNMKKVIRLTENDLHRIIKESVKRVISENQENELDWKTYLSASNKSRENNDDRQWDFLNAADKSFDKKHGVHDGQFDTQLMRKHDGTPTCGVFGNECYVDEWYDDYLKDCAPDVYDARQQVYNFNNGKSKYVKGKGWQ